MNLFRTFAMALKSIANNKMRSFLTMLGIIIGVCSVITLLSLVGGMTQQQLEQFEKMGTNIIQIDYGTWNGKYIDIYKDLMLECKKYSQYISAATPVSQTNVNARYRSKKLSSATVYFGNEDFDICKNMELSAGRTLCYMDVKNRVKVCVIGSYVREQFFGLENPIGKKIKLKGVEYTVVGTYVSKYDNQQYSDDGMIVVPMSCARSLANQTKFTSFIVKARSADSTNLAMFYLGNFMRSKVDVKNNNGYIIVYTNNQWQESISKSMRIYSLVGGGVAGISLLVGGIGIMNIMLVSVTERTREIGIRMAIGAKRSSIVWQFLIEAATISACGGLLGIGLGAVGSYIITAAIIKQVYFPSFGIMLGAMLFSVALGIFFGFYPANKASKMQPVEALRNQ